MLRKKRARDGKSSQEMEPFPAPKSVTVRNRPTVAALELRDEEMVLLLFLFMLQLLHLDFVQASFFYYKQDYAASRGSSVNRRDRMEGSSSRLQRIVQDRDDGDQYSGDEDEMSE